jgi:hypothetical protein
MIENNKKKQRKEREETDKVQGEGEQWWVMMETLNCRNSLKNVKFSQNIQYFARLLRVFLFSCLCHIPKYFTNSRPSTITGRMNIWTICKSTQKSGSPGSNENNLRYLIALITAFNVADYLQTVPYEGRIVPVLYEAPRHKHVWVLEA